MAVKFLLEARGGGAKCGVQRIEQWCFAVGRKRRSVGCIGNEPAEVLKSLVRLIGEDGSQTQFQNLAIRCLLAEPQATAPE